MQSSLFPDLDEPSAKGIAAPARVPRELVELADALPTSLHLGTSSWHYPGWIGSVWDREYPGAALSRHGLPAYAAHPLLRTVSLDRGFYRPLDAATFAEYRTQVPEHFRFMVKAPSVVTDAVVRDGSGRGKRRNDYFLDPDTALRSFIEPALEGLGSKLGPLIFQISPLPGGLLSRMPEMIQRLRRLLRALPDVRVVAPEAVVAVEVRNPQWLTPDFVETLGETAAVYCLGLHARMPSITEQLPILRALWPGPLVCRWSLNALYGAFGYEEAKRRYQPFDRLVDPDIETRNTLARVVAGTVGGGHSAWVSFGNKAEGSAPLSVIELGRAVRCLL